MHRCSSCGYLCQDRLKFFKHLRKHQNDDGFHVECELCGKEFTKVWKLRHHLYWHKLKENRVRNLVSQQDRDVENELSSHDKEDEEDESDDVQDGNFNDDGDVQLECHPPSFVDRHTMSKTVIGTSWIDVADFLLSLQSDGVPKKACEAIVRQFKLFGSQVAREVMSVDHSTVSGQPPKSLAGLSNIDTAHKLSQFALNERGFIASEPQYVAGFAKPISHYVPMAQQIKTALECENVYNAMNFETVGKPGLFRDVFDGTSLKRSQKHLHVILYYDEFNVSNPIGNKTKKCSIGAIYYSIANQKSNSSIKDIYLAMLFNSSDVNKHSWKTILSPMLTELVSLETEGLSYVRNGQKQHIRCALSLVLGDNKGVHQLAGYFTAFHRTNRICRFCHASTASIQSRFKQEMFEMRTREQYESEMRQLEMEDFNEEVQTVFGLKRRCELNQVPSFHCIDGFPVDVTHDLFEKGVVGKTIEQLLSFFTSSSILSLWKVNEQIRLFPFHRVDINKPQPLKRLGGRVKVSETCSETWALLRTLPLILLTAMDNCTSLLRSSKGKVLTALIDIVQCVMSDQFSNRDLEKLEEKITLWLSTLSQEFPDFTFTPKFHYLIHYASQIRSHGPVRKYAAIRYEAKHQELKKYLAHSRNRINPCKSMANCHQISSALILSGRSPNTEKQGGKVSGHDSQQMKILTYNGYDYHSGDCISVKGEEGGMKFVQIEAMSVDNGRELVSGKEFRTVTFAEDLMAFEVSDGQHVTVDFRQLFHYHPMGMYRICERVYVVPQNKSQFVK